MINCVNLVLSVIFFVLPVKILSAQENQMCGEVKIDTVAVSPNGRVFISKGDNFWILDSGMQPTNENSKSFAKFCAPGFKSDVAVWIGMNYTKTQCDYFRDDTQFDPNQYLFLIQKFGKSLKGCFLRVLKVDAIVNIELNPDSNLQAFFESPLIDVFENSSVKVLNSLAFRRQLNGFREFVVTDSLRILSIYECVSGFNDPAKWKPPPFQGFGEISSFFRFGNKTDVSIKAMWHRPDVYIVVTSDNDVYECYLVDVNYEREKALEEGGKPCAFLSSNLNEYLKLKTKECRASGLAKTWWIGVVAFVVVLIVVALVALVCFLVLSKNKKGTKKTKKSSRKSTSIEKSGQKSASIRS